MSSAPCAPVLFCPAASVCKMFARHASRRPRGYPTLPVLRGRWPGVERRRAAHRRLSRDPPHDDPASCPICSLIDPLALAGGLALLAPTGAAARFIRLGGGIFLLLLAADTL